MFRDCIDAAQQLADRLKRYRGKHALILAILRGAVRMAKIIADQLAVGLRRTGGVRRPTYWPL